MQTFKFLKDNDHIYEDYDIGITWKTGTGRDVAISSMTSEHIRNTINCLLGTGETTIPNPYLNRSHSEWIIIFRNELIRRNETI